MQGAAGGCGRGGHFSYTQGRSNAVVKKRTKGAAVSQALWKRSINSEEHASSSLKAVMARKSFSFRSSTRGWFESQPIGMRRNRSPLITQLALKVFEDFTC